MLISNQNQVSVQKWVDARYGSSEKFISDEAPAAAQQNDGFTPSAHTAQFAGLVRVPEQEAQAIQSGFEAAGVKPNVATAIVASAVLAALGSDPATAVGIDGAMRILMLGDKPTASGITPEGLSVKPFLEFSAAQIGSSVEDYLAEGAASLKQATPEELADARCVSTHQVASVIRAKESDISELRSQFSALGVAPELSQFAIDGLIVGAFVTDPAGGEAINALLAPSMMGEKPISTIG